MEPSESTGYNPKCIPVLSRKSSYLDTSLIIQILEVGFGTGLNALLTLVEAERYGIRIHYTSIESSPLPESCWGKLNYPYIFGSVDYSKIFARLHHAALNCIEEISPHFSLHKINSSLEDCPAVLKPADLVYFDAFGPDAQPELWSEEVFKYIYESLEYGGILVTYSVKGSVVRAMKSVGFTIEKLSGPPGKRHILRAVK